MNIVLNTFTLLFFLSLTFTPAAAYVQPSPRLADGRKFISDLGTKGLLLTKSLNVNRHLGLLSRQEGGGTEGPCGAGVGVCADGYCCSAAGYCGQGADYCTSPGCQLAYGPACQGNTPPLNNSASTAATAAVPRPALGTVPYGAPGLYACTVPGTIAVTYDDGPSAYTADLLDKLAAHGARATFFVVGNNGGRGQIDDPSMQWGAVVARMAAEGHQVASHTWTHEDSSLLSEAEMMDQMVWNEVALVDVLGYFPTYMRPPYEICSAVCETVVGRLGYHVVNFDLDTADYLNDDPGLIQNSKGIWDQAVGNSNPATDTFLEIGHDIHYQTVYNLTDYILTDLKGKGYSAVTVGECLGDPKENWYRQGPVGSSTKV